MCTGDRIGPVKSSNSCNDDAAAGAGAQLVVVVLVLEQQEPPADVTGTAAAAVVSRMNGASMESLGVQVCSPMYDTVYSAGAPPPP